METIGGGEALGARWMLGSLLLTPLSAIFFSYPTILAILILGLFILLAAYTNNDLNQLTKILPPQKTGKGRRERNLHSFADFMGLWMTFLSHLVAVAICARILSATADHISEGKTRRWLFGYETTALGEPWPDVWGVAVVIAVCGLYMCGVKESVTFTIILVTLLYIFIQCFTIVGLLNFDISIIWFPPSIQLFDILSAGAPIAYSFSFKVSKESNNLTKSLLIMVLLPMVVLSTLCLFYKNMFNEALCVSEPLPVTTLLESKSNGWPFFAVLIVTTASVCFALTELCPILFTVLVHLASQEWKVLTRSMMYKSTSTGSPVLAVFTAGSLAAILAFACPLMLMITLLNASHLMGIAIQALHFIIMRCVPTTEQREAGDIAYKRLDIEGNSKHVQKTSCKQKSALKFLSSLRHTKTLESIKSKVTKDTEERECLLLDEYGGCPVEDTEVGPSNVEDLAEIEDTIIVSEQSDQDATSGDDSTDIDAVVKEYQDRVQVVTATPVASAPVPPSVRGSRLSIVGAFIQLVANPILAIAFCNVRAKATLLGVGIPLWIVGTLICAWQPAHGVGTRGSQRFQGPITMLMASLFLTPLLIESWPAIVLFAIAGVVIYARCTSWCGDLAMHQTRELLHHHPAKQTCGPHPSTFAHCESFYIARYESDSETSLDQLIDVENGDPNDE